MIKNLLDYQEKDKQRLTLIYGVEGGAVKREINAAKRVYNDASTSVLGLEKEAQGLQETYNNLQKSLKDLLATAGKFEKATPKSEDEIQKTSAEISALLAKVSAVEGQLENVAKNINQKTKIYKDKNSEGAKAYSTIKALTPQYESQLAKIKPDVDKIEGELAKMAPQIDKKLLEKYKSRREAEKGKISNIVVPVQHGRCGACHFEMPLSLGHKIQTDGYIICEECGKILYKDK